MSAEPAKTNGPSWVSVEAKAWLPHIAKTLGIQPIPRPRWMPKFWHRRKKRRQREETLAQWVPCRPEISERQVRIMIAQEFRDFAEMILGYSDIDPEKSSIPRSTRNVLTDRWIRYINNHVLGRVD